MSPQQYVVDCWTTLKVQTTRLIFSHCVGVLMSINNKTQDCVSLASLDIQNRTSINLMEKI
jgi:hypothetical protein